MCTVPRDPHRPLGDDRRLWPPSPSEPSSPERDHVTSPVSASASLQLAGCWGTRGAGKTHPRTTTGPGAPLHHALSLSRPGLCGTRARGSCESLTPDGLRR